MSVRLDKYLCSCGVGTRNEAKKIIRQKRVTVNGIITDKADTKVSEEDVITLDGEVKNCSEFTYIMLNKPDGCICATKDPQKKTVLDFLSNEYKNMGLFPVGRLDRDTHGLVILTNDGDFAHRSLSPSKHIDKTYSALVSGDVSEETAEIFNKGVIFKDFTYKSAKLIIVDKQNGLTSVSVTIHEGRYHQVKRMFEAVGCKVEYLRRISFGEIVLDENLAEGEYRLLNDAESEYIRKIKGNL